MKYKLYALISKLLKRANIELHFKDHNHYWTFFPFSKEFDQTYRRYNVRSMGAASTPIYSQHVDYQLLSYALTLEGDVAEVGIYKGATTSLLASLVEKTAKQYHVFDTFEGLPDMTKEDSASGYGEPSTKLMADNTLQSVKNHLKDYHCIQYHKGLFPATANGIKGPFCFVYLDMDIYQSTKDGLQFFYPRMVKGGVIIVDDYASKRWVGVRTAVSEFAEQHPVVVMQ